MNNVTLTGRLTKNADMHYIPGTETPVATFTIAIDRDYTKKDGSKDTDFIPIEVVGKVAEFCAKYLTKGRLVAIQGSIRIDRYVKEGQNRTFTKVRARSVQALDKKKEREDYYEEGSTVQ